MRKWIFFPLAILLYVGIEQSIEQVTFGFWVKRVVAHDLLAFPSGKESPKEVQEILKQPFHLIGAGSECFAFASQDDHYVIKLFKLDTFRPVYLHRGLLREDYSDYAGTVASPSLLFKRLRGIREYRIQRSFHSNQIARHELPDQTALLYLHLNPSTEFTNPLILYDRCGIKHTLDLNEVRFVVQKKAKPLLTHFEELIKEGKIEEGKQSISSLLSLLKSRCLKGIADRDILCRNFGYVGLQAIEIDTGSFSKNPHMKERWLYTQEIYYATLELKTWLKAHSEELAEDLESQVNGYVAG